MRVIIQRKSPYTNPNPKPRLRSYIEPRKHNSSVTGTTFGIVSTSIKILRSGYSSDSRNRNHFTFCLGGWGQLGLAGF